MQQSIGRQCQFGRASRYRRKLVVATASPLWGEKVCVRTATTVVSSGCWEFGYCTEHAHAVLDVAGPEWEFSGGVLRERVV